MLRLATVVSVALLLGACSTYKIGYRDATAGSGGSAHEVKQNFFLWGLAGGQEVELDRLCGGGVASIESQRSVVDGVLTVLTGGLYTPMTVQVRCADGSSFRLEQRTDGDTAAVRASR